MKILKILYAAVFSITLLSCESVVDTTDKPGSSERSIDFKILLKDKTGSMSKLFGSDNVPGVSVNIRSITLGTEYTIKSDTNGIVTFSDVISDKYIVSAIRWMSQDEMKIINGNESGFYKLMNSGVGIIDLSADYKEPVTVYLDNLLKESPLVISEVYACGPPGAGLYIHDRYMEVYNQSDEVVYLDGLIIADIWSNPKMGINFIDDPVYIHSKKVWKFPGTGKEYPIRPGQFVVCTADGIDHTINAPQSVDLSHADFEFYKDDAPDVDNPEVPNMVKLYQAVPEVDWTIGGESGALCILQMDEDSLKWYDNHVILPYSAILDGMEYIDDLTYVQYKRLNSVIDASFTGGIQFYTGKSMERIITEKNGKKVLKDDNNSMLDFRVLDHPTPGYHHQLTNNKRR